MKNNLTIFLKKSLPYRYLRHRRNIKAIKGWSSDDEKRFEFYKKLIKPGDLVFDVGANIGNRTKIFLKLNAKVVAFEPQKACSKILQKIFKEVKDFTLVQKALGSEEGSARMYISDENTISTLSKNWTEVTKQSGRFIENSWNKRENVSVTTLDKAIKEFGKPTFIKIDVEGYEYEVLCGLTAPVDLISIEFASENAGNGFKCIDYLNSIYPVLFQFAKAEEKGFYLNDWIPALELKEKLTDLINKDPLAWGDIYIKNRK